MSSRTGLAAALVLLATSTVHAAGGMREGIQSLVLIDRLEYQARDGDDGLLWDAQAWAGGDLNKAWFKAEGEYLDSRVTERSQLQALYSRAIAAFWDLQAGLRHSFRPGENTSYAVLGIQGLAPWFFEVDAAAFLSEDGDVSARFEAELDSYLNQRFVLQPRIEFGLAASDAPQTGIGSGLTGLDAGLRLRYEVRREFAPYVGIEYAKLYGDTAELARRQGEPSETWQLTLGVRLWF